MDFERARLEVGLLVAYRIIMFNDADPEINIRPVHQSWINHMLKFEIYKDKADQFRWRLRASNGKIIADSGEGYVAKADCQHAIGLIQSGAAGAEIVDNA